MKWLLYKEKKEIKNSNNGLSIDESTSIIYDILITNKRANVVAVIAEILKSRGHSSHAKRLWNKKHCREKNRL